MTPPAIMCSVCIANYNGEHLLDACLESIFSQDTDGTVEIIVHDDASTDASLAVLARYPSVIVIRSLSNVGFCESNNRMVAASHGRYVLLLNNDAALMPGALAALEVAANTSDGQILTLPQFDWETNSLVDMGCLLDPFMNPVPVTRNAGEVAMVIGACLWIPRKVWDEIGGFPRWIESIAEDMYLCCAARYLGYVVRCIDSTGYRHMQGKSFGGNRASDAGLVTTYRRRALSERNKTALLLIFTPSAWLPPVLALHVATLLFESAILSIARASFRPLREIYWPALRSTWRRRELLLKEREQIQRRRIIGTRSYYRVFTWLPRKVMMLAKHGMPSIN
ncbi:glycosyltransferase [Luteibacter aegosomaticola]|uniref:glycosyltransferase family 2 protein n=1 Tax=Luteibacter aegosomaticola TaxID=2911538 RepID=UPI001FFB8FFE|nr:glycosyltransferase [Luteibacter aegosomaticola]UPG91438.1 glycosyltransferase [Luteibacter aegosomaticola]